jgi:hypothetical protein
MPDPRIDTAQICVREFAVKMKKAVMRYPRSLVTAIILMNVAVVTSACGGSLYKVKPVVSTPIADGASGAEAGGVKVRAVPLLVDEEIQELFETNLLLAGILPVRVEIGNSNSVPVELKKARLNLRDGEGHAWKMMSAKKTVARILDYYAVYLYNPNSRAKFEEDFRAHAFDFESPLPQGGQRTGLIFFQTPKKEPVASPRGLILSIDKLPHSLELKLN